MTNPENRKPKIGIVGNGTVGGAMARVWVEYANVMIHDSIPERSTHSLKDILHLSDFIFLCLPTPPLQPIEGISELSVLALSQFAKDTSKIVSQMGDISPVIIIKSTLPIGYTRKFANAYPADVYHSPEFLTSRCSVADAFTPSRVIIGSPYKEYHYSMSLVVELHRRRFSGIPILTMTSNESEAVKLIQNGFFATKVTFFTEMRMMCDKMGLDWDTVLSGILADGRISHSHTQVPGPDGHYGYGGSCLPKDMEQLHIEAIKAGNSCALTHGVITTNKYQRERHG